nr:thymidylate synthase [Arthrobacter sp. zg-Y750]
MELEDPRARVSRSQSRERIISGLAELLWYLSGSDSAAQIGYYVPYYKKPEVSSDGHVIGAYGPRLMDFDGINQVHRVIDTLKRNPSSRNAVIQIFDHEDSEQAPCTLALQFVIRNGNLDMLATMRSNDLILGFPHDIFAFTMLQEVVARSVDVDLGTYYHSVGSLHLYTRDQEIASRYTGEGWHRKACMPAMPAGDPWVQINALLVLEEIIRTSPRIDIAILSLPKHPYWRDLALILVAYRLLQDGRITDLALITESIHSSFIHSIVQDRLDREISRN